MVWGDDPIPPPEKVVTHEALRLLTELREAAQVAQDAYRDAGRAERGL